VSDKSINRLTKTSSDRGCIGWVMLLYAERATTLVNLSTYDAFRPQGNCDAVAEVIADYEIDEIPGADLGEWA
jgi:hypothetical protein